MKGAPRSRQFDDIYFSAENGLEETQHVFLQANNLPEAWRGSDQFTIAETGFGTGLNFLAAWKLFEETAEEGQTLDFISTEKYPLEPEAIKEALMPWADHFGTRINDMLAHYPIRINGFHRLKINPQITLTLLFDDINDSLPNLEAVVDCWFLDGFTPAKNPEMWSETVFHEMARLSRKGATFGSFTAAGDVRRGLDAVGFKVEKRRGYGHKRDMIAGSYEGGKDQKRTSLYGTRKTPLKRGGTVAIIGGGLAGTACAYILKQYGYNPVIYEAEDHLASGASGNQLGLYNPRFSKLRDSAADFFSSAYAQFIGMAQKAGAEIAYDACGTLHLIVNEDKQERFFAMTENWGWPREYAQIVTAEEASKIAGIGVDKAALYLKDSGTVSPEKVCHYYAHNIEVQYNKAITDLDSIKADAIILANAASITDFRSLKNFPINKVRGQVSKIKPTDVSAALKCNLCYGGYISPALENEHMIGATFERWMPHCEVTQANHAANLKTLHDAVPSLQSEDFKVTGGRASMRAASNDRFPLVGLMPNMGDVSVPVYVASAFGSQGLLGTLMAAHLLADYLRAGPLCLPIETVKSLFPRRFIDRAKKKGRLLP